MNGNTCTPYPPYPSRCIGAHWRALTPVCDKAENMPIGAHWHALAHWLKDAPRTLPRQLGMD